ncbi:hypothetical protein M408DRAFT_30203 [Serendipita vermifera MAFF 305830]|uniref:Activator of Hsp90 ATPase AHSA1-like N-terminal domain-containing protein n=1 Tax=Serendipita vermifera MAFF 305830 TaxID=933852 RepID=A0A0C3A7N9_SERVB|nr:hypothetical protein M408DRAFT_30203 [Serendipita vermifera MAFF 305830]
MSMSSPTTNWHRKTKHVSGWAKEWFTSELAGASKQDGSDTITVERLTNFDGDVEIGRRKNKYASTVTSAEEADNAAVKGTIVIPEVSHENMLDGVSDYAASTSGWNLKEDDTKLWSGSNQVENTAFTPAFEQVSSFMHYSTMLVTLDQGSGSIDRTSKWC